MQNLLHNLQVIGCGGWGVVGEDKPCWRSSVRIRTNNEIYRFRPIMKLRLFPNFLFFSLSHSMKTQRKQTNKKNCILPFCSKQLQIFLHDVTKLLASIQQFTLVKNWISCMCVFFFLSSFQSTWLKMDTLILKISKINYIGPYISKILTNDNNHCFSYTLIHNPAPLPAHPQVQWTFGRRTNQCTN